MGGGGGGRERKGEKARDDRSGKPGGKSGSEECVCSVQRGRMGLETTMGELPPVGERGCNDLEIRKGEISEGGGEHREGCGRAWARRCVSSTGVIKLGM